jgi:hypothetical protein
MISCSGSDMLIAAFQSRQNVLASHAHRDTYQGREHQLGLVLEDLA